jgi:hypothetical protein
MVFPAIGRARFRPLFDREGRPYGERHVQQFLMQVEQAQADVRQIYRRGFAGPLISSLVWFVSSATYQWVAPQPAMAALFLGGMLIFPLTTLLLKLLGGPSTLPKGHPSTSLAVQAAFIVPLGLFVAIALGLHEPALFFPAALIIVGAHYLVFISLYGMRLFAVLAAILLAVGTTSLFWLPNLGGISGWVGATVLLVFSVPLYRSKSIFIETPRTDPATEHF